MSSDLKPDAAYFVSQAAKGLDINLKRAERLIEDWKNLYPKIEEWRKKLDNAIIEIRLRHAGKDHVPKSGRVQTKEPNLANQPRPEEEVLCDKCGKIADPKTSFRLDKDTIRCSDCYGKHCPACGKRHTEQDLDGGRCSCGRSLHSVIPKNTLECLECKTVWTPGYLSNGDKCDNLNCGTCTGKECPECGGCNIRKWIEIKWEPESHWDEHPNWPVEDWKYEISEDNTRQGYHEWVRSKIEEFR
jgi:hypothetical protein